MVLLIKTIDILSTSKYSFLFFADTNSNMMYIAIIDQVIIYWSIYIKT